MKLESLTLERVGFAFGGQTARRQYLYQRLQELIKILMSTGSLSRLFLFGSFVTGKATPNHLDLMVVMKTGFSTANLDDQRLEVFQYEPCRLRYHSDLFWLTEAVGEDKLLELLAVFSRDREQHEQPIIEVKL